MHLVLRPTAAEFAPAPPTVTVPQVEPPQLRNNIPNFPIIPPGLPSRPPSTPLNQVQGMQAQQQLPGFQHIHQHQILQPNDINGQALRLQQMQRETQRLYQDIGLLEQRVRALTPQAPVLNAQHPVPVHALFQGPQRQAPMPPFPPGFPQFQNFLNQHQRERVAQGSNGVQDTPGIVPNLSAPGSGRASPNIHRPDHTTTYTREGIGPNGQRWQVTVNETTTTLPHDNTNHHHHHLPHAHVHNGPPAGFLPMGPFGNMQFNPQMHMQPNPVQEIQAILRNADRLNAQHNMQRSASNSQAARPESQTVTATSSNGNASAITPPSIINGQAIIPIANQQIGSDSTTYILSSPTGPQALLISNSGNYWTPRQPSTHYSLVPGNTPGQDRATIVLPEFRNRHGNRPARHAHQNQQDNAPEPLNAPHANPGAGALAAQLGPMIWLIIRLAGFVWFLTSGNPSWTRFFVISSFALILFLANTGIFNGVAEQLWGPIRRHLEALIPLAGPDAALVPAANAAVVPRPEDPAVETEEPNANPNLRRRRRAPEPDPAQLAARIIEQRRQNQGWVFTQIRRAEHALLLFLASLVPGVGERHIAAREAEATAAEAERQRQIESENENEATATGSDANVETDGHGNEAAITGGDSNGEIDELANEGGSATGGSIVDEHEAAAPAEHPIEA
jgi:hypothetical protein